MSTDSPATKGQSIPTRRVLVDSPSQLPSDYCTTPGGTLFSTTPGGTRLIYDRKFLMKLRESPLAKSPPKYLNQVPGVTCDGDVNDLKVKATIEVIKEGKENAEEQPQFEMDI